MTFSTNGAGTIEYSCGKKKPFNPHLTPYKEINSKWIINLNVKAETIKLLKEMSL